MSKKKSRQTKTKKQAAEAQRRPPWVPARIAIMAVSFAVVVSTAWWLYHSTGGPDLQSLVGRWARTDGNYQIAVRSIAEDGAADAAYFNPRPIHVAEALASTE